ncbi:MAG: hypothetical protein EAZ89_12140, partial [Bacteroidetes bacterium]
LVFGPDGKENEYYLNESSPAQYDLEIGNLSEGAYSYTAEGRKNDKVVGEDKGQFSVGRTHIEAYRLQADADMLRQLALRTGGEFIYARNLAELPDKIKALPGFKPLIDYRKNRNTFHEIGWILALLLLLLSVEWVVRKLFSLL